MRPISHVKQQVEATLIDYHKFDAVLEELKIADDRSSAILIFAFIDEMLEHYMREHLNPELSGGVDKLFEAWGMLATANARITFAYTLYWINKNTYADLNIIRRIRNLFAHHADIKSFDDERASSLIHSITQYEKPMRAIPVIKLNDRKLSVRQCFLFRSTAVLMNLVTELMVMHRARLEKIDMRSVVGTHDAMPENLKQLKRKLIRYMLIYISPAS